MELIDGYKHTELGVIPGDWSVTTMGAVASNARNAIVGGPFGSDLVSKDYVHDGVPVIRGQNMGPRWVQGPFVFVSHDKAKSLEANLAAPGDIVFTQRGTLGQVSLVPDEPYKRYMISQSQMKATLNPGLADPSFVHHLFTSELLQETIRKNAIQTGVPHINLGILRQLPVICPPVTEQRAIAEIFGDVNNLLSGLDKLIAKKRDIKQAAMQQLLTGKTRLPGFSGEWEVKRIGDVLRIRHGKDQKAVISSSGQYPVLATGGQIGWAKQWLYNRPSVLIGRKGTIDRPQYMEQPFWTVDTLFYSELTSENVAKYFYYRFCLIDWLQYNEASGVPSLNARTIETIELACPVPEEQTAIAKVLSDMDAELAALEARRDKTRLLKQGMMQELLTGKTRLV